MSTIQQDMTDTAVQMEHVAKRLANVLGSGSDEAWDQATQIHAAATIIRAWVDKHKAKVRAAVDEDAPRELPMLHTFEEPPPCKYHKDVPSDCNAYYRLHHPHGVCHRGLDIGACHIARRTLLHCNLYEPAR